MDPELFAIDRLFCDLAHQLPHGHITPTNLVKVQRQFSRKRFSPTFEYGSVDLDGVLQKLDEISVPTKSPAGELLAAKRQELIDKAHMIKSVGTDDFTKYAQKVYPKPTKSLIDKAHTLLSTEDSHKSAFIGRLEARRMLRSCFKELGFTWTIRNEEMTTSARVDPIRRILHLRKKERFRKRFVERLVIHEIGTHAMRAENGALQPLGMFMHGLPGYLDTEEGLAVYNEERAGILEGTTLRNYAGRVLAVHYAEEHSFLTTFKLLRKDFTAKQALKLTLRVKRGLAHPEQPGAFTRDASYLRGYVKVKRFAEKEWIQDLFLGKIGIEHVDLVKKIPGVLPARHTPDALIKAFTLSESS